MTNLYPYQQDGVRLIEHFNGRVLLADEMGLGKTIQALEYLRRHPELRPAVVIAPANVKWVWEREARIHCNMSVLVGHGRKPPKKLLSKKGLVLVINYEIAAAWKDFLRDQINPQILICDEVHMIKSYQAKRTKAVRAIAKKVRHILALSGTPLTNRPKELYTTLRMLWPKAFPAFMPYAHQYCDARLLPWGWNFDGAKNLKELHKKLTLLGMIRRRKKDVLHDLPAKRRLVVPMPITNRADYQEAAADVVAWLRKHSVVKAQRAESAKKLVQMAALKRLAAEGKLAAVFNWIDSFLEESDGKLVVYAHHLSVVRPLHERYHKTAVVISGDNTPRKRSLAVDSFQNQPKIRLFIGNRAAVEGITLTAASTLAFAEMWFTPGLHTQAEDRIHRIGQTQATSIYYLVAKDTIEESLCQILQRKQQILTEVLDGKEMERDNMNVYDLLTKVLMKGNGHG